ncbi:PQQ-binding-like beta-propeller repeat protein [Streptomyces albus]|uniref:outer membrane protein assembly factor BamB family protein n=1 Tax=Streptomyces albus TaxID=1888 RepID=UPI0033ED95F0
MEPLRQDDPRRLGPYTPVGRLEPETGLISPAARRFLALAPDGDGAALLVTPPAEAAHDPAHRQRFHAEARAAQTTAAAATAPAPWLLPVGEVGGPDAETVWYASPYRPALPLPTVLDAHGPLPGRTLLAIGTALADALARLHAAGLTHAGVLPDSVLLTADGPRLTGYGTARIRAAGSTPHHLHPFLPPEQLDGGPPRPLGDVHGLAAVLAFAATARPPRPLGLPPGPLRDLLTACLDPDPAARPTAGTVLARLPACFPPPAPPRAPVTTPGPPREPTTPDGGEATHLGVTVRDGVDALNGGGTVLDGGEAAGRGATVLDGAAGAHTGGSFAPPGGGAGVVPLAPGWLPRRVSAALAVQAAAVLAAEADEDLVPAAAPAPEPTAVGGHAPVPPRSTEPAQHTGARSRRAPSRRAVLTAAGTGVAGAAVGGAGTWALTSPSPPRLTEAQKLAARRSTRKRPEGAPPTPLWRYDLREPSGSFSPFLWRDRIALLADGTTAVGVDIRTGNELWRRTALRPQDRAWVLDDGSVLLAGDDLVALDPHDGSTTWRARRYRRGGDRPWTAVLAAHGGIVWLAVEERSGGRARRRTVVAHDIASGRELWSSPLPAGFRTAHLLGDFLVVVTGADGEPRRCTVLDRRTGRTRSARACGTGHAQTATAVAEPATLVAATGSTLRGYALTASGGTQWKVKAKGGLDDKSAYFGVPVPRGRRIYVTDTGHVVHRIDAGSGEVEWRAQPSDALRPTARNAAPDVSLTPDGEVLLCAGDFEVDAFNAADGALLWRFTDLPPLSRKVAGRRRVAAGDRHVLVVSGRGVHALPLDRA